MLSTLKRRFYLLNNDIYNYCSNVLYNCNLNTFNQKSLLITDNAHNINNINKYQLHKTFDAIYNEIKIKNMYLFYTILSFVSLAVATRYKLFSVYINGQ